LPWYPRSAWAEEKLISIITSCMGIENLPSSIR
jgi:hypothetical protein